MFTESIVAEISMTKTVQRRGVGKALWKRVIENIIASEKEDMQDMAVLRRLLHNNLQGQKLLAEMADRKTIRVMELTQLLHYNDRDKPDWDVKP